MAYYFPTSSDSTFSNPVVSKGMIHNRHNPRFPMARKLAMYGQAQSDEDAIQDLPAPKLLEDPIEWSKGYVGQTNIPRWIAYGTVLGGLFYFRKSIPFIGKKKRRRNPRKRRR